MVAPAPPDLRDRRVEITGPSGDLKMVINALNSGAKVFMADFEDANSPTWRNTLGGQLNLRDAANGTIAHTSLEGREYRLNAQTAALMARPRGRRLPEKHVLVDGEPVSGALFDFGLYFYHNARELLRRGTGPHFYLPKLEGSLESRLWNDMFDRAQERLGVPRGTIKATVLVETIPRRLRDGRDPVRAARPLRGAQLRAVGLYLQLHQEAARPPGRGPARPRARDDDRAVHARVLAPHDRDVPPARGARDGRYVRLHPHQRGRAGERSGACEGARG
jgi:hypothetical protein